MKAIGICGSPRANGNTELLVKRCLGRLEESGIETRLMLLREKKVLPCTACGFAASTKTEPARSRPTISRRSSAR